MSVDDAQSRAAGAAIDEAGVVFVSAGAGTGRRRCSSSGSSARSASAASRMESVLVITYTERAAGELRARIRERLLEIERPDLARDIDRGWISTIHGFCNRLLQSHPFEAGLDPGFRVLDESQSRVLRSEAFTEALAAFCVETGGPARSRLLATYGADGGCAGCSAASTSGCARPGGRSSSGRAGARRSPSALAELREVARDHAARAPRRPARAELARATSCAPDPPPPADELLDLSELRVGRGAARALVSFGEALDAVERRRSTRSPGATALLLEELLVGFDAALRRGEGARVGARLRGSPAVRPRPAARSEAVREQTQMALPLGARGRVPGHEPAPVRARRRGRRARSSSSSATSSSRSTASATPTSRCSASAARRAPACLPLTQNYRSRPEVLAVVNQLFGTEFGTEYEPLVAAGRFSGAALRAGASSCSSRTSRATARGSHWRRPRRGTSPAACASSWTRARRRRARSCSSSPRARTPSATRRRCGPRACRRTARRGAATSASSRSAT